jgi:hypothetical protein
MGEKKSYTYYSVYMSSSGYPSGQSNNHLWEFLRLYDFNQTGQTNPASFLSLYFLCLWIKGDLNLFLHSCVNTCQYAGLYDLDTLGRCTCMLTVSSRFSKFATGVIVLISLSNWLLVSLAIIIVQGNVVKSYTWNSHIRISRVFCGIFWRARGLTRDGHVARDGHCLLRRGQQQPQSCKQTFGWSDPNSVSSN